MTHFGEKKIGTSIVLLFSHDSPFVHEYSANFEPILDGFC